MATKVVTADKIFDNEKYTTQQCKDDNCGRFFKVKFGEGSPDPIAHCPYCNYQGQFWTLEQMHYLDCWARLGGCKTPDENGPNNKLDKKTCKGAGKHTETIKHDGKNPPVTHCIICGNDLA